MVKKAITRRTQRITKHPRTAKLATRMPHFGSEAL
jgi:hypothetical protein